MRPALSPSHRPATPLVAVLASLLAAALTSGCRSTSASSDTESGDGVTLGAGSAALADEDESGDEAAARPSTVAQVVDARDFERLAEIHPSGVRELRYLVVLTEPEGAPSDIVFLDSKRYGTHADYFKDEATAPLISERGWTAPYPKLAVEPGERRLLAGSLLWHPTLGFYFQAHSTGAGAEEHLLKDLAKHRKMLGERFHPAPLTVIRLQAKRAQLIELKLRGLKKLGYGVLSDEEVAMPEREFYRVGTACGTLRVFTRESYADALREHSIRLDDILLVEGLPGELPEARALITAVRQPRLSYVNRKAQRRGAPSFFTSDRDDLRLLKGLQDRPVRLSVTLDSFLATEIEKGELKTCLATDTVETFELAATEYPVPDAALIDLAKTFGQGATYGAVALDRAWLLDNRVKLATWGLAVDGAAAASLHWFPLFLKSGRLEPEYKRLVTAAVEKRGIIPFLGRVRLLLKTKGTIPKGLRQGFAKALKAAVPGVGPNTLLRLTPSSNAAALPLLDATSAHSAIFTCLADLQSAAEESVCAGRKGRKPVTLDAAVRALWTQLYDDVEFGERLRQGVDSLAVSMGFVVEAQPAPGRFVGVAVTASLFGASGLQQSGVSLALLPASKTSRDLDPTVLPAQAYVLDGEIKLNRRSSLIPAADALPPAKLVALAGALEKLEDTYMLDRALSSDDYALEVRFRVTDATPDVVVESIQPILLKK